MPRLRLAVLVTQRAFQHPRNVKICHCQYSKEVLVHVSPQQRLTGQNRSRPKEQNQAVLGKLFGLQLFVDR